MKKLKNIYNPTTISCLIVDDELGGRENLRTLINDFFPYVTIGATAHSAKGAKEYLSKNRADVVFLDIMMPNKTGLEFINELDTDKQNVVFVTAYEKFALEALKANALDYLLKPICIDELSKALEKVSRKVYALRQRASTFEKLTLSTEKGLEIINTNEIIYIQAEDSYCHIFLKDSKKIFLAKNLKYFNALLSPHHFFRIHRSYLINLSLVAQFRRSNNASVILTSGEEIPVSRRKIKSLAESLLQFNITS